MKETKFINCGNGFSSEHFDKVCRALERGERVRIGTDAIGHSLHCAIQEEYNAKLKAKYGERLTEIVHEGVCRYSYSYSLAK